MSGESLKIFPYNLYYIVSVYWGLNGQYEN